MSSGFSKNFLTPSIVYQEPQWDLHPGSVYGQMHTLSKVMEKETIQMGFSNPYVELLDGSDIVTLWFRGWYNGREFKVGHELIKKELLLANPGAIAAMLNNAFREMMASVAAIVQYHANKYFTWS